MYCRHCGAFVSEDAVFCSCCGRRVKEEQGEQKSYGSGSEWNVLFSVLSFFVPIAGLILFLVYETKDPLRAKAAGKWALIGFAVRLVLSAIVTILGLTIASSAFGSIIGIIQNYS